MVREQLETLLATACNEKYLTHYYIEAGFLRNKEPAFVLESHPRQSPLFDLASLTKALATYPIVLWLEQRGQLSLNEAVGTYLPGVPAPYGRATLAELLAHRGGYPAWLNFWIEVLPESLPLVYRDREEHCLKVLRRTLADTDFPSNETYSDVGFIVLGLICEKVSAMNFAELVARFQDHVQLSAAAFLKFSHEIIEGHRDQIATTGYCPLRQRNLVGAVHDENCAAYAGVTGHCGLFGTGRQTAATLKAITENFPAFLAASSESIAAKGYSLGLRKGDDPSSRVFGHGRALGHLGFTGTAFWIDPEVMSYGLFLSNRVISGRLSARIKELRREVFSSLQAVLESSA